jgi:hypothetical protein
MEGDGTMRRGRIGTFSLVMALIAVIAVGSGLLAGPGAGADTLTAHGGGTTMVRGGTGDPSFVPVITTFSFFWTDGKGGFECLAFAPSAAAGDPGSGQFDTNVMYVTGKITSAMTGDGTLVLEGTAEVTGAGAGSHRAFTAVASRGGPGATLVLRVSGLTFKEILTEGEIVF